MSRPNQDRHCRVIAFFDKLRKTVSFDNGFCAHECNFTCMVQNCIGADLGCAGQLLCRQRNSSHFFIVGSFRIYDFPLLLVKTLSPVSGLREFALVVVIGIKLKWFTRQHCPVLESSRIGNDFPSDSFVWTIQYLPFWCALLIQPGIKITEEKRSLKNIPFRYN